MSYNTTAIIPRVTAADITAIKAAAGRLASVVKIAQVDTPEKAATIARVAEDKELALHHQFSVVTDIVSSELDEAGENYVVIMRVID